MRLECQIPRFCALFINTVSRGLCWRRSGSAAAGRAADGGPFAPAGAGRAPASERALVAASEALASGGLAVAYAAC